MKIKVRFIIKVREPMEVQGRGWNAAGSHGVSPGKLSGLEAACSAHLPANQDLTWLPLDLQSASGPSGLILIANDSCITF